MLEGINARNFEIETKVITLSPLQNSPKSPTSIPGVELSSTPATESEAEELKLPAPVKIEQE